MGYDEMIGRWRKRDEAFRRRHGEPLMHQPIVLTTPKAREPIGLCFLCDAEMFTAKCPSCGTVRLTQDEAFTLYQRGGLSYATWIQRRYAIDNHATPEIIARFTSQA